MCGIAGFVPLRNHSDPAYRSIVESMVEAMAHRGPDESVVTGHFGAWLGSTRLAIVDREGSRQPIVAEEESVSLYFNGEIYNFVALRDQLRRTHHFRTSGDGEVIAHGLEEAGPDYALRLDGMFAFAAADARDHSVVLVRDRFGIKPLYYWIGHDGVWFASELKVLMRCPFLPRQIDRRAVDEYLSLGFVPQPRSIVEGVRQVEPGSYLRIQGGHVSEERYWRPAVTRRDPHAEFGELWLRSVETTVGDSDHLSVFLSGGLDSSAIAASVSADRDVTCISVGYDSEGPEDETDWAGQVARHLGLPWVRTEIATGSLVDHLSTTLSALDEPIYSTVAPSTLVMSNVASEYGRVAMSGDGADELFASYSNIRAAVRTARDGGDWWDAYLSGIEVMPLARRARILRQPARAVRQLTSIDLPEVSPAEQLRYFELRYRLPAYHLTRTDRLGMAFGLETRVPFLRNDVVGFALGETADSLCAQAAVKSDLRRAMRGRLTDKIVDRPKQKFSIPLERAVTSAVASGQVAALIRAEAIEELGLDPFAVYSILDEFVRRPAELARAVWGILTLNVWCSAVWHGSFTGFRSSAGAP